MSNKPIFLLTAFIVLSQATSAQQIHPYNKAVIWRGFDHNWTYNHRCNRIGDFVQLKGDSVLAVHTSATGTGPDYTTDTSYFSTVATPDAVFNQGQDTLYIRGYKDSLIVVKDTVYMMAPNWMRNKREYITLLNGFDLQAYNSEAEKPRALYLNVTDATEVPSPSPDSVRLQLIVKVGAVLNCSTPECHICNHTVSYKLTVYYLIVGLEPKRSAASSQLFTTGYSWNKKEEMKEPPLRDFIEGTLDAGFKNAVVGIKSFTLTMDKDHWLVKWNNSIKLQKEKRYNADNARVGVTINQEFVDWKQGMQHSTVPHSDALLSFKQRGWEIMNINAGMLQFTEHATIKDHMVTGQMKWTGNNEPAGSPNAIMVNYRAF